MLAMSIAALLSRDASAAPGRVRFEGSVELTATNTLYIELGGTEIGEFDQLDVRDNVSIDGFLEVSLFGGFELLVNGCGDHGQDFPIIVTDNVRSTTTGQFIGLAEGATVDVTGSDIDSLYITYNFGDGDDVALLDSNAGAPPFPGDVVCDGFVDADDLFVLLSNWDQNVSARLGNLVAPDTTPVDADDLFVLLSNWTGPNPNRAPDAALADAAVPEPSALLLTLMATLGLCACWRRRRCRSCSA